MSLDHRIAQFRKMAEADPGNELAHFSLGKAYLEAGQNALAAKSFQRVLEINSSFSRAYEYLAEAQMNAGDNDGAVLTLTTGFTVAQKNGDLMPRNAMGNMLRELGKEPPPVERASGGAVAAKGADDQGWKCVRCGCSGPALAERPFKGNLGALVKEQVCSNCWREWIAVGTKVINEFRLDLSDPQSQELYDQQMIEFLNLRADVQS